MKIPFRDHIDKDIRFPCDKIICIKIIAGCDYALFCCLLQIGPRVPAKGITCQVQGDRETLGIAGNTAFPDYLIIIVPDSLCGFVFRCRYQRVLLAVVGSIQAGKLLQISPPGSALLKCPFPCCLLYTSDAADD